MKPALVALVKNLNIQPRYVVDELLRNAGIEPVRLPPYFCIYNPIEMIWSVVKCRFRNLNSLSGAQAAADLVKAICEDPEVNEMWAKCVRHVIEKEEARDRRTAELSSTNLAMEEGRVAFIVEDDSSDEV